MPRAPPRSSRRAEPSFLDSARGNPLLLGLGGARRCCSPASASTATRQRSKKDSGETSFLESRLQPDSFFGASGGQRIDTRDAAGSSSSMTYSLSQLDAIGDVDPVAEADVYLAYGRDLQAEEILKEAMRSNPERLAIRTKLLEVYAKRRDIKGFELLATQLFALTRGEGEDWAKAQELGAQIDPGQPALPAPAARPSGRRDGGEVAEPLGASTMPQSIIPVPSQFGASVGAESAHRRQPFDELDLDLDNPESARRRTPRGARRHRVDSAAAGRRGRLRRSRRYKMPLVAERARGVGPDTRDEPLAVRPVRHHARPRPAGHGAPTIRSTAPGGARLRRTPTAGDPLSRKLELAEEFQRIGDKDGARDLLREVLATASGATKTKAQGMLDRSELSRPARRRRAAGDATVVRVALGIAYRGTRVQRLAEPARRPHRPGPRRARARRVRRRARSSIDLRRPHRRRRARAQPGRPLRHRRSSAPPSPGCAAPTATCPATSPCSGAASCRTTFHSRASALGRRYAYLLLESPVRPALETGLVGWTFRPLDGDAMRRAAAAR